MKTVRRARAEVAAICGEAASLLEHEPVAEDDAQEELRAMFVALHAGLAAHAWCCDEVHVNVHWW